jgi:membrane protease YdiL (CAAX protease family)
LSLNDFAFMMSPSSSELGANSADLYDARWQTKWVVVGVVAILLWRSTVFLDRAWMAGLPQWFRLVLGGLLPHVFLLLFPLVTRDQQSRGTLRMPSIGRCFAELGIAAPIVIAAAVVLWTIDYVLSRVLPGISLTPEAVDHLALYANPVIVLVLSLFAVALAPITEEVFFRGFLQNALRARMPMLLAAICQSLLFGFAHFLGTAHALTAFVVGLIYTLVYEWRKVLVAPIFVHAGLNLVAAVGLLFTMTTRADRPVLGVGGDPNDNICVVRQIAPGTAADAAGLRIGDKVMAFNGEPIEDFSHLVETVRRHQAGDVVTLTIDRDGSSFEAIVELKRRGNPTLPGQ